MSWAPSSGAWRKRSKVNDICRHELLSDWLFAILTCQLAVSPMTFFHELVTDPRNSITAGESQFGPGCDFGVCLESCDATRPPWTYSTAPQPSPPTAAQEQQ